MIPSAVSKQATPQVCERTTAWGDQQHRGGGGAKALGKHGPSQWVWYRYLLGVWQSNSFATTVITPPITPPRVYYPGDTLYQIPKQSPTSPGYVAHTPPEHNTQGDRCSRAPKVVTEGVVHTVIHGIDERTAIGRYDERKGAQCITHMIFDCRAAPTVCVALLFSSVLLNTQG